jgi:hypothetical protein
MSTLSKPNTQNMSKTSKALLAFLIVIVVLIVLFIVGKMVFYVGIVAALIFLGVYLYFVLRPSAVTAEEQK